MEKWPTEVLSEESDDLPESKEKRSCNVAFSRLLPSCIEACRFQRWIRLVRVTALVLKAVRLFKKISSNLANKQDNNTKFTAEHLEEAKVYWYKKMEKEVFPEDWYCLKTKKALPVKSLLLSLCPVFDDELDLIRVGGRLQFADLPEETKHQIVLPAKHPVVEKLVAYTHEERACHPGSETTLAILRE
jgi:hypothetical protein